MSKHLYNHIFTFSGPLFVWAPGVTSPPPLRVLLSNSSADQASSWAWRGWLKTQHHDYVKMICQDVINLSQDRMTLPGRGCPPASSWTPSAVSPRRLVTTAWWLYCWDIPETNLSQFIATLRRIFYGMPSHRYVILICHWTLFDATKKQSMLMILMSYTTLG